MKAERGKGKFTVISNLVIKCELITEFTVEVELKGTGERSTEAREWR